MPLAPQVIEPWLLPQHIAITLDSELHRLGLSKHLVQDSNQILSSQVRVAFQHLH